MTIGARRVIKEFKTRLDSYEVIEEIYTDRPSRLLYGGRLKTAQSGIPLDHKDLMLFEYNQRLVELVDDFKPKSILLIGGGVYTLPSYLATKHPSLDFEIVEPDKALDDIAFQYFNFKPSSHLNIVHDFGLNYLKKNQKTYDLIIIDAYSDQRIPEQILSKKFSRLAAKALNSGGLLAANVISDLRADSVINTMHLNYRKYFKEFKVFPVGEERFYFYPRNLIYVLSDYKINIHLKYRALSRSDLQG